MALVTGGTFVVTHGALERGYLAVAETFHGRRVSIPQDTEFGGTPVHGFPVAGETMQALNNWIGELGAPLGALLLLATGCGGVDDSQSNGATDPGSIEAQTEPLRAPSWSHHRPPNSSGGTTASGGTGGTTAAGGTGGTTAAGGTGGTTASGGSAGTAADCSICTTTQACCLAVEAGALCTFSADTCASLDPGRQATYANYCLTVTRTTISAWAASGATPPPECTLP